MTELSHVLEYPHTQWKSPKEDVHYSYVFDQGNSLLVDAFELITEHWRFCQSLEKVSICNLSGEWK